MQPIISHLIRANLVSFCMHIHTHTNIHTYVAYSMIPANLVSFCMHIRTYAYTYIRIYIHAYICSL